MYLYNHKKINKHPHHLYCVSISGSSGSSGVYLRFIHDPLQSSQHDVQK